MSLRPSQITRTPVQGADWLTLAEAKVHLQVDFDEDDGLIQDLLDSTVDTLRDDTGHPVVDTQVVYTFGPVSEFPSQLNVPGVSPNYEALAVQRNVNAGGLEAQTFKALPFYQAALRCLFVELEDEVDLSDTNRATFQVSLTEKANTAWRKTMKSARLMLLRSQYDNRDGDADPKHLRAYNALISSKRVVF